MERKIKQWLARYGKQCRKYDHGDNEYYYDDCQMIDDCCYDTGADRRLVTQYVDDYIREH